MLGLTFFSFVIGWYMMGVVIVIFCGVYLLYETNSEEYVRVSVSEEGIMVGGEFFEVAKIREFGVIYMHNRPVFLRLIMLKKRSGQIDLVLDPGINVVELRNFLGQMIEENEHIELSFIEEVLYRF